LIGFGLASIGILQDHLIPRRRTNREPDDLVAPD
tara:strand:+ start:86 stop:187 length:102 start_codon:yes stop_codon:yes gene_type:complete